MWMSRCGKLTICCGPVGGREGRCGVWDPRLYVAIVRPTASFASLLWWPSCQTATAKKELSKVQRLACLGITGAISVTPTGATEALVGLPSLDLVIEGEASSVACRLWSLGSWYYLHPQQGHICILNDFRSLIPYLTWESTVWSQFLIWNPNTGALY